MKKDVKKSSQIIGNNNNKISSLQTFDQFRLKDMLLMAYDVAAVTVSYFFALWFRFDGRFTEIPREYLDSWMKFAPIYILISILVLWAFHLYQSLWRFASFVELKRIICASAVLSIAHTILITVFF